MPNNGLANGLGNTQDDREAQSFDYLFSRETLPLSLKLIYNPNCKITPTTLTFMATQYK